MTTLSLVAATLASRLLTRLVEQNTGTVTIIESVSFYEISNGNISPVPATDGFFASKSHHDFQLLMDWEYDTIPQVISEKYSKI